MTGQAGDTSIDSIVENGKAKVLVVYEDGHDALEAAAREIKAALSRKASIKLRAASEVSVPEILAASSYAFGVANAGAHAWLEIRRVLGGMNLAGRRAAFFVDRPKAAEQLKAAFAPAELRLDTADFTVSADGAKAWSTGLVDRP